FGPGAAPDCSAASAGACGAGEADSCWLSPSVDPAAAAAGVPCPPPPHPNKTVITTAVHSGRHVIDLRVDIVSSLILIEMRSITVIGFAPHDASAVKASHRLADCRAARGFLPRPAIR